MARMGTTRFPRVVISDGASHYLRSGILTTTQRDALTAVNGMVIYNSTTAQFETYEAGSWVALGNAAVATHAALINGHPVETLANEIAGSNPIIVPPWTDWTESNVGTGNTTPYGTYIYQECGATALSSSLMARFLGGVQPGGLLHASYMNYDKKFYMSFLVWRNTAFATGISRLQLKDIGTIGQLAEKGFGIQISNYTMVGESYGTGRDVTATLATMVSDRTYKVTIVLDPGVSIKWYVDGVLKATQSTAAQIPTGEGVASLYIVASLEAGDPSVAAANVSWTLPRLWQAT